MTDLGIDLEHELDRLYGLPVGEFVAARNELAKRLRLTGDRDASTRIKKLPRPSQTAWAVNQLAFTASSELEGLMAAGEKVRTAHLAGPREQQAAGRFRRDAIATLRVIAEVALQDGGVTPNRGHRQRISQTLEVLSSQGTADDPPRAGRLSTDLEPAGFDALTDLAAALAASQKARPPKPKTPKAVATTRAGKVAAPEPEPSKLKVVEHPSSRPQEDPAARQAAARRAAERRALERRRQQAESRLRQLEEKIEGLRTEAEHAASTLDEAKQAEASLLAAAREAERLATEARGRVATAASATSQARREAESAVSAVDRQQTEIEKARRELAGIDAEHGRLGHQAGSRDEPKSTPC